MYTNEFMCSMYVTNCDYQCSTYSTIDTISLGEESTKNRAVNKIIPCAEFQSKTAKCT